MKVLYCGTSELAKVLKYRGFHEKVTLNYLGAKG